MGGRKVLKSIFTVESNIKLAYDVFELKLFGDTSAITAPGQFVNIELAGLFLRRPISVCEKYGSCLTLIYKVIGKGTEQLSRICPGEKLDLLSGLGNGYDTSKSGNNPVLIGGGAGVPPMYMLAKALISEAKNPKAILGFNSKSEVFYEDEFRALGIDVIVTTTDGSSGTRGFVTDALKKLDNFSYTYSCGPEPMLKAVYNATNTEGQFSFEERMGCGFGACMGCSCETKYGFKRICRDGPILEKGEIIW